MNENLMTKRKVINMHLVNSSQCDNGPERALHLTVEEEEDDEEEEDEEEEHGWGSKIVNSETLSDWTRMTRYVYHSMDFLTNNLRQNWQT